MILALLDRADDAARFLAQRGCTALRSDSRRVRAGEGFIAWPGTANDSRAFVSQALAAGAAACLVEADGAASFGFDDPRVAGFAGLQAACGPIVSAFLGEPSRRLDVLAVTGTNGKTSTAWWTALALARLGRRCGLVGTLGVGEPPSALEGTGLTTPDPVTLQSALARWAGEGWAACAMEASSIGLAEHRLAGTRIAVAMFTNFTRDHLDYHGSMAAYWAAKRALFDWPGLRAAVIDVDDAQGAALAAELQDRGAVEVLPVSTKGPTRLRVAALRHDPGGLAFDLVEDGVAWPVRTALAGEFNAANLLVVAGALRALGLPLADIVGVLPGLPPVPGRMQPVAGGAGGPLVLVDYAHTPDALEKALHALRPAARSRGGRLWCLFGCGGNRDASKRPLMGAIAERLADTVVLTSDNPRHESPRAILDQIVHGLQSRERAVVVEDRAEAIAHAIAAAAGEDVVLLAGKGHEATQEVAGEKRPFVDADVAARALAARRPEAAR